MPGANIVYNTSGGFQSSLQAQSSQASAVTVDSESVTNSCPLHNLNLKNTPLQLPNSKIINILARLKPNYFLKTSEHEIKKYL